MRADDRFKLPDNMKERNTALIRARLEYALKNQAEKHSAKPVERVSPLAVGFALGCISALLYTLLFH